MNKDAVLSKAIINSISSVIQVVIQGITYFFLYKYLLVKIGSSSLGLWSLIIATTSSANVANLGITNSLVPYLAEEDALGKRKSITAIISTGFLLMLGLITIVAVLFKFFAIHLLGGTVPDEYKNVIQPLINYSSICLLINALSGIYLSSLEGLHKLFIKNIISIISSCILLLAVYLLVDTYGLLGAVYAQIIQASLVLVTSYIFLQKAIGKEFNSSLLFEFDKNVAKRLLRSGYKFQIISFTLLFFDPLTKYLLSIFGGLNLVAYYEMANRLVTQFRNIIVMAGQSLIPMIANYKTSGIDLKSVYANSFKLVFGLSISLCFFLALTSGAISIIWMGHFEKTFVFFVIILSIGWFYNIISTPLYFINIGLNKLEGNVYSHIILFIMNIGLGYFLGKNFGGLAVIVGVSFSLFVSSVFLIINSAKVLNITLSVFFGSIENTLIIVLTLFCLILMIDVDILANVSLYPSIIMGPFLSALVLLIYLRKTPVFKELVFKVLKLKKT